MPPLTECEELEPAAGQRIKHPARALARLPGEVAEWSIAAVLKTAGRQRPVGSNPTLSVLYERSESLDLPVG
jgi:hypothetical protein